MLSTFEKLNLKEHKPIVVLNAPESFEPELAMLHGVAVVRSLREAHEIRFSLAFVTRQPEVDKLAAAIAKRAKGDAVVWFAYRKEPRRSIEARSIAIPAGKPSARRDSNQSEWLPLMRTGQLYAFAAWNSLKR
jgi:hypothetical protein